MKTKVIDLMPARSMLKWSMNSLNDSVDIVFFTTWDTVQYLKLLNHIQKFILSVEFETSTKMKSHTKPIAVWAHWRDS